MKIRHKKHHLLNFFERAVLIVIIIYCLYRVFPIKYTNIINEEATKNDIDPYTVCAIIKAESNFNPYATSHAGACGLMQITPSTADYIATKCEFENYNPSMLFDENTNIVLGTSYLKHLYEKYEYDDCVFASYNAGEGNVDRWLSNSKYSSDTKTLSDVPYGETKRHIQKIKFYKTVYSILYFYLF